MAPVRHSGPVTGHLFLLAINANVPDMSSTNNIPPLPSSLSKNWLNPVTMADPDPDLGLPH
jgi:hypothetical protein